MNDEIENKALRARKADIMARIDAAMDAIQDNYWKLCDAAGRAVNPHDLGLPDGAADLLDDAFGTALKVEEVARRDGIPWMEARNYV